MHELYHLVRYALSHWGYFAIIGGLLGECAGLPLPGETILIFSSFLAHKDTALHIQWIILIGIAAATSGDNLGFWVGRRLGPRLLRWLRKTFHIDEDIDAAKDQIRRHGPATIFWARYIFGLRTIAGPVAGALGMAWIEFLVFNILGAATWVTSIAMIGYAFANKFHTLLGFFEKLSWIIALAIFSIGFFLWRRKKKRFRQQQKQNAGAKKEAGAKPA